MQASTTPRVRRVSPRLYRLLLTAHLIAAGIWLGVAVAKLALAAAVAGAPGSADLLAAALRVVDRAFPPAAVATIASGVLLSLGTKWGLLRHTWVVTKLVLSVVVIVTAVRLGDPAVRQAVAALTGPAAAGGTAAGHLSGPSLLIALVAAHVLMLTAATILSVYKPWGTTWWSRRSAARSARGGLGAAVDNRA